MKILWTFGITIGLVVVLSIVTVHDIRYYRISNLSCFFLTCIAICNCLINESTWIECMLGIVSISLPLTCIYRIMHKTVIGGGDIKLLAASGILLGWQKNIFAFLVSGISLVIHKFIQKKHRIPYKKVALGPYLSLGILVSFLFGDCIIGWYLKWPGLSIHINI